MSRKVQDEKSNEWYIFNWVRKCKTNEGKSKKKHQTNNIRDSV